MKIYAKMVGNESIENLKEENERLKRLVKKYEKDSKKIISKSLYLKDKEKTSVMETLELFRLNAYLIECLPNAEQILKNYLKINNKNSAKMDSPMSSTSNSVESKHNNKKDLNSKSAKKPVMKPISNYFKTVDKRNSENGENDSDLGTNGNNESDVEPGTRRSPRKSAKAPETSGATSSQRKRKQTVDLSQNESSDEEESPNKGTDRSAHRKTKSNAENKTVGPKRTRRPRVPEKRGYFPCSFDPKQCNEMMETKEQFDFHMSGHYDAEFVCPFCAYTGPTIQIIKRHINLERERAAKEEAEGLPLNADALAHKEHKYYHCFGCKACDKIHEKHEKRCEHIREDLKANQCDFSHDIDYEFKDHLKKHFEPKFANIKDKDERRQRIRTIVDKFVEKLYFENNAKKHLLVEKFQNPKEKESKASEKISKTSDKKSKESSDSDD